MGDAVQRPEPDQRGADATARERWLEFTRRAALTGGAAGLAGMVLEACGSSASSSSAAGSSRAASIFASSASYKFTFVNHVRTNAFFKATRNGAADACRLLGCSYEWTGSDSNDVSQMVSAMHAAIRGGVDGIAVSLIDPTAFNAPTSQALAAGIPVVAYNADAAGNPRLAYIGQDLFASGQEMGARIAALVPSGDIALFIATPGALNLQPRLDGVMDTLRRHASIVPHIVATGPTEPQQVAIVDSYVATHTGYKGFFAVDGGSTAATAKAIRKHGLASRDVKGGGYDLTPVIERLLAAGEIQFTIDQQAYLQGFFPILELCLYKVSRQLTGIADVDTGVRFLDSTSIQAYHDSKSRYEGTAIAPGVREA